MIAKKTYWQFRRNDKHLNACKDTVYVFEYPYVQYTYIHDTEHQIYTNLENGPFLGKDMCNRHRHIKD